MMIMMHDDTLQLFITCKGETIIWIEPVISICDCVMNIIEIFYLY